MPRSLVIGNGKVFVDWDADYNLRDLFYPRVGQWNHTLGNVSHTGVFADGRTVWFGDDGWERRLGYVEDTLVTEVVMRHEELGVELRFHDYVDMARDLMLREVEAVAVRPVESLRLFFHYDWYIGESDLGGTVLYDPKHRALIAYKNDFYFLMGGQAGRDHGINSWATGKKGGTLAGTWQDAEDGELSRNPIEQGSVDCTMMFDLGAVRTKQPRHLKHWLCFGRQLSDVSRYGQDIILQRGEQTYRTRTETYWRVWSDKDHRHINDELGPDATRLYRRSILTVRTHVDSEGGVIAAADFDITKFARDTYSYVWPRDGALAANALDRAGHEDITRLFFSFCRKALMEEGFFLHKYTPAGDPGSSWHPWVDRAGARVLPVQEDETGLVLWALWEHYRLHRNLDFAVQLYTSLVVPAATWMMNYADQNVGLPRPSWDLWEERWGVHAFTVGAVWAGLRAAMNFADLFGDDQLRAQLKTNADILRQSCDRILYREDLGRFARRVNVGPDGIEVDGVLDSAVMGLWRFGMYAADEPKIVATMRAVAEELSNKADCAGIARYRDDYYFQVERDVNLTPGNPWFICTLWLAQWQIAVAKTAEDLQAARDIINWTVAHQLPGGLLSEQLDPHTGAPLSVSPLTWSHAEFVITVDDFIRKAARLRHIHSSSETQERPPAAPAAAS